MHLRTRVKAQTLGRSGQGFYNDAMMEHDDHIGALLNKLDELGIADNTIVFYSTDNGPHYNAWPDAGISPFRSEKNMLANSTTIDCQTSRSVTLTKASIVVRTDANIKMGRRPTTSAAPSK